MIATCGVRRVPYAWVEQTAPGGVVLFPLETQWCPGGYLVRMEVDANGHGVGRFRQGVEFMTLRAQRAPARERELTASQASLARSSTELDPCLLGEQRVLLLVMSALTPGVEASYDEQAEDLRLEARADDRARDSVAIVRDDHDGHAFPVMQAGPRRLWDETVAAWDWWVSAGRPDADRFGITVRSAADQRL